MKFKHFGVFLDLVGNGALNINSFKKYVDYLAMMDYNLIELGLDDMFKIDSEPFFGYLRGGYKKEVLQEMESYANSKGIQLIPCIQTLGHMDNVLSNPHYFELCDIENILLVDDVKVDTLIEKMFISLRDIFKTNEINLGFDEAHYVGLGKYLDLHGYHDRFELLLKHLNKVVKMAEKYNFKVHIWADMFYKLANNGEYIAKNVHFSNEVVEKIPKGIGLCYWDYDTMDESVYDSMFTTLEEAGVDVWFGGAANTWWGYAPLNTYSIEAMKPAIKQIIKHNVEHVMFTSWGNAGHECSFFAVLPTLYTVKQFSLGNFDVEKIKHGFKELFNLNYDDFMLLDIPNKNAYNPELKRPDSSCRALLVNDCFLGKRDLQLSQIEHIPFEDYKIQLEQVAPRMGEFKYLFDNMIALCDALSVKAELGIKTRNAYLSKDKKSLLSLLNIYEEAAKRIDNFRMTYRKVWMIENTPYGWDYHEKKLGGLIFRIRDCALRIKEYLDGIVDNIPELEDEILVFGDWASVIW